MYAPVQGWVMHLPLYLMQKTVARRLQCSRFHSRQGTVSRIAIGLHNPLPIQHPIFAARISRHRKHGWQSDRIAPLVYEIINNEGAVYGYCLLRDSPRKVYRHDRVLRSTCFS